MTVACRHYKIKAATPSEWCFFISNVRALESILYEWICMHTHMTTIKSQIKQEFEIILSCVMKCYTMLQQALLKKKKKGNGITQLCGACKSGKMEQMRRKQNRKREKEERVSVEDVQYGEHFNSLFRSTCTRGREMWSTNFTWSFGCGPAAVYQQLASHQEQCRPLKQNWCSGQTVLHGITISVSVTWCSVAQKDRDVCNWSTESIA